MSGKILQAKGVTKRYGKQTVLDGLDFAVEPGRIYGLVGRNGAGKTTLLSVLTGQSPADGGSVTYGGAPVWENAAALGELCFARELTAAPNSFSAALRVKDYWQAGRVFYPHWDEAYAARLAQQFRLEPKKKLTQLSRGQVSMVSILLGLASRAPVTIFDEPAAGLDVVAREQFYRLLLDDYAETGRSFVVSTHIIEEAAGVFEQVAVLDGGRLIANCPTEELIDGFRYVSGEVNAVAGALADADLTPLHTETLGRHTMAAVRGGADAFARLSAAPGVTLAPMSLQNVFVALCGHEEG